MISSSTVDIRKGYLSCSQQSNGVRRRSLRIIDLIQGSSGVAQSFVIPVAEVRKGGELKA